MCECVAEHIPRAGHEHFYGVHRLTINIQSSFNRNRVTLTFMKIPLNIRKSIPPLAGPPPSSPTLPTPCRPSFNDATRVVSVRSKQNIGQRLHDLYASEVDLCLRQTSNVEPTDARRAVHLHLFRSGSVFSSHTPAKVCIFTSIFVITLRIVSIYLVYYIIQLKRSIRHTADNQAALLWAQAHSISL